MAHYVSLKLKLNIGDIARKSLPNRYLYMYSYP